MSRTETHDNDAPIVPLIHPGTERQPTELDRLRRELDTIRTQLDRIESTITSPGEGR